jgi:hypothetical protein
LCGCVGSMYRYCYSVTPEANCEMPKKKRSRARCEPNAMSSEWLTVMEFDSFGRVTPESWPINPLPCPIDGFPPALSVPFSLPPP